jgi:ATP-dependent helicase HepA
MIGLFVMQFVVGQRWASQSEPSLGLGVITQTDYRRIEIAFPSAEELRTYAIDNAPLCRIKFLEGDDIRDKDGITYQVNTVFEKNNLYFYDCRNAEGESVILVEMQVDSDFSFHTPKQRLFSGQLESLKAFKLRVDTAHRMHQHQQSPALGLMGVRASLIPHQLYIANDVASRHKPRVLLADEVGLGKTIEAGMIIHHQLITGAAQRVLILVPASLQYQWIVEMLRRFHLRFSLFDQERVDVDAESNPFESEQLLICDIELLANSPQNLEQALTVDWDLVVIDEAHHLAWSEQSPSQQYQCAEQLADKNTGLLLLTATPEQAGLESHFSRLRLLDNARFSSYQDFLEEHKNYAFINEIIEQLEQGNPLSEPTKLQLSKLSDLTELELNAPKSEVIAKLIDRCGTGRMIYRNTRKSMQGFPRRIVHPYPLEPSALQENSEYDSHSLYPESGMDEASWLKSDPRIEWLVEFLKQNRLSKVLVICHYSSTAISIDKHLNLSKGIRSTLFHEGLSLVERDRAAAYFADDESGAQVLICSEIGSEGRNFQFAHNLVLFDLPANPDLVEQRIGRLDRIGQSEDIHIHVPYLNQSAQSVVFEWMHQGLGCFENSCSFAFTVYDHFAEQLNRCCVDVDSPECEQLIIDTQARVRLIAQEQSAGKDRLLQLHSFNESAARQLVETIENEESEQDLQDYMDKVFDYYGVDSEDHSDQTFILRPGQYMRTQHFPELDDEGSTITYGRHRAISREDIAFLSWEHPMVAGSMDMILSSETGQCCVSTMRVKGMKPGSYLVETFYQLNVRAPKKLQLDRFLSLKPMRLLISGEGKSLTDAVSYEQLNQLSTKLDKKLGAQIVQSIRAELEGILERSDTQIKELEQEQREAAKSKLSQELTAEIQRLTALAEVNPTIKPQEIEFLKQRHESGLSLLNSAQVELQAIRVIINS